MSKRVGYIGRLPLSFACIASISMVHLEILGPCTSTTGPVSFVVGYSMHNKDAAEASNIKTCR